MDNFVSQVAVALQGQLTHALLYLLGAVAADFVLGVAVAGITNKNFHLRALSDFWVTTVGYQKLVAFAAALVVMFMHGDQFTHAIVAAMALFYATSILPDIYDKLSTLLFKGKLPLSSSVAQPTPTPAP